MTTVVLIPGGVWQDGMTADRFWRATGVTGRLEERGFDLLVPDRAGGPDWSAEAAHLCGLLPAGPVTVVAGSNGCSAAVRVALRAPDRVQGLVLAWPATAGDPAIDGIVRAGLTALGASTEQLNMLLAGETLRGVVDSELASLTMPIGVLPSVPENRFHQRRTADALLALLPNAGELPGCVEPPHPGFDADLDGFVDAIAGFLPR
jgi:pimeloyl-ACP methyl ester carboxylesterase